MVSLTVQAVERRTYPMPYTQDDRPLVLSTSLGDDAFVVTGMTGTEELSQPFHFTLDLVSDRPRVDATALLGKPALLAIAGAGDSERLVHGLVSRFRRVGAGTALTAYQLELVAWPWMLSLSTDCRIFQKMSVPDIVSQVFKDLGFADFRLKLVNAHPPREFCVQYRETHLDFVSRLLEDEGIFYFFEHEAEHHWLVLTDASSILKPCAGTPTLKPAPAALARSVGDQYTGLVVERAVRTRAVALAEYNYRTPSAALGVALAASTGAGEWFDYPGGYDVAVEGDRLARMRLETMDAEREGVRGTSNAPTLTSGFTVQLPDTPTAAGGTAWLVVSVRHGARAPEPVASDTDDQEHEGYTFESEFTFAAADLPWRPPNVTPRPKVYGTQSALVVGVAGEEIFTDAQGRVKLHFHWDRRSRRDENSSCWIRCSSAWAGQGYGQFSVPRIGQEVLVDFLEGNPDRPVVIGRVFNAEQQPPCDPGGSRGAVSGVRSRTHRGSGYNELTMDDTKGRERISIHAQYDMSTVVEHDDTLRVVAGNRTVSVEAGTHTETIKGDTSIAITTGSYTHDVRTGTATIRVKGAVAETFDADQTTAVKHKVLIDAGDEITLRSGDSTITLASNGTITIGCKHLAIVADADIKASAPTVEITAGDEAKFGVGNQQMTCDKAKVSVSGAGINASAVGTHEITGALVKIN